MAYNRLKNTSTIKELIFAGKQEQYSSDKLHLKTVTNSSGQAIIINLYSIIDKYIDDLEQFIQEVELTDSELIKYRFQPKKLCVDLYDTIDLAPLILKINNMTSLLEFDRRKLRLFRTSITTYLNEITVLETNSMAKNSREVDNKIDEVG